MPGLATIAVLTWLAVSQAVAVPNAGDKAPEFAGTTYDGQTVSVSTYAGKVVVLSFWASWCAPCRKELPILEGVQLTAGKERLQVVAVNIESSEVFRKIAPKMQAVQMLVASDAGAQAQRSYGVSGIPHMVIIGRDGHVIRVHRGYSDAGVDDAIDDLNRALAQ
jgi:peroxiredoxin